MFNIKKTWTFTNLMRGFAFSLTSVRISEGFGLKLQFTKALVVSAGTLMLTASLGFATLLPMAEAKPSATPLVVDKGIVYLPLEGVRVTAGYGTLKNKGKKELNLKIVSAQGFKAVELHETIEKDGLMKMQKLDSLKLKAKERFELRPGGNHLMLFDPLKKFKDSEDIQITFNDGTQDLVLYFSIKPR